MDARMSSADLAHLKALGFVLCQLMKSMMSARRACTL